MIALFLQDLEHRFRHVPLLVIACLLTVTGLVFIASTCYAGEHFALGVAWQSQALWWCLALLVCLAFSVADFRGQGALVCVGYLVLLGLLVATLLGGQRLNGASRSLALFGGHSFQTGLPARLFTILAFSAWLARPPVRLPRFWHGVVGLLIVLAPVALIAVQPAMGNALVTTLACAMIAMIHCASPRVVRWGVLAAIMAFAALIPTLGWLRRLDLEPKDVQEALDWWPYQHHRHRVVLFLDPDGDRTNEQQIDLCLRSGGFRGKGWFRGDVQNGGFLPRGVAGSDYIIATIGEEAGFLGCISVLGLCAGFLVLCLRVGGHTVDPWGRLICVGVGTLFAFQVLISVGMALRLCPIIGLTIPFLGRGGTLLVTAYMGLGLVVSVQRFSVPQRNTLGARTFCEVHPPRSVLYREDQDTVVVDLLPYGPIRFLVRLRWESAAASLQTRGQDALRCTMPKRGRRGAKSRPYRKHTLELPGFRDALGMIRNGVRRGRDDRDEHPI